VLIRHNASLSHHHGVGLLRSPYMQAALGETLKVMAEIKAALDPHRILNPGNWG
jgi:alkyldihydroxyacetonephosphate synthase